ncbi:MAG: hypothetical protein PWQ99_353 [Clostridia bacterium]|jgi:hypothetical protein|uniref:Uncharacterized protein n=1 Tax=Thermacetogenium phaeum TaxID=85874 RepID=A0A101FHC3_9THEO|nr:MAG: Uncharacterized protein XD66_0232 [Thermacetogenium phaeum]MDK2880578.1 hypothetical protein [Clostridia bacterium]MDN5365062.1 hypothetical protein [Thermacetogenium sp.]MDN5375642.1 hypothetical protein [Thermacetogenium sp.]
MPSKSLLPSSPSEPKRKADVNIRLSEFEIPPMQDVLLVGKRAPIGPEAIRRMVSALSPDQYEVIQLDHDIFEAVVLKKSLVKLLPKEKLLPVILEEGARIATEKTVVKAQVNIEIQVSRVVDL